MPDTAPQPVRVLILGAGPAGCTAAVYAARAMLAPVLVKGPEPGGQLTITTEVENYPGFADPVLGPELMNAMLAQAENAGATLVEDTIAAIDLTARPMVARGESGAVWLADTIIVAVGARAKWLGVPGEVPFRGYGVSACAVCDGFFFKDVPVATIGGGDTAAEEALFLSRFASEVFLVHRRDRLRASPIMRQRLEANPKITMLWNRTLEEVIGDTAPRAVRGARLRHTDTGKTETLPVEGVFIAIGHEPQTEIFRNQLAMDADGFIVLPDPGSPRTDKPGVFVAGDAADRRYRQAVTAAGTGCMAALEAARFIEGD